MNEARTKAHSKDYAAAISLYDALLKVNPDNLEAKIGKARVLSWTGKYEEAQELYEAVLSRDPENIEASIGLADLNAWQKRYGKATEILESLLSVDRENREVLLRLARFHLWAGEKRRSIRYCDEILEKFPDDPDAKAIRNQAREIHAFEYYAGYQFLKITDNPDGHNLYAGIRYLPKTKISLYSQLDYLDRYGETDMRGLLGGSWQIHNKWTLSSEMGVAPDAEVYPRLSGWAELTSPVLPSTALSGRIFGSQYKEVDSYGVSLSSEYYTVGYISIAPRITFSRTEFHSGKRSSDTAYMLKVTKFFTDRDKVFAYFSYGSESYKIETLDRVGDIDARTYGVGCTVFLNPEIGISPFAEYQDRDKNTEFFQFGIEVKIRL